MKSDNRPQPAHKASSNREGIAFVLRTHTPEHGPVFMAGNWNNWAANDPRFELKRADDGSYRLELPGSLIPGYPLEYKYTRGSWDSEETDRFGSVLGNRFLSRHQAQVQDEVPRWKQQNLAYKKEFMPKIEILSEDFEIPSMIKTRRLSVLLPYNYHETDKRYPVVYLQDGQNLFDDFAPFGNWGLTKRLAVLAELGMADVIVVAIDHAEEQRIAEFTPSFRTRLGVGDGKKYVRFLADRLKPYIDQHFRTLPDRRHTGIGGSSMGGLISLYAGIMYPEVYSKLMIFSPSLWVSPQLHQQPILLHEPGGMQVYLYAGGRESENMLASMERLRAGLVAHTNAPEQLDIHLSVDPEGQHNEHRWGIEFPYALEWLFYRKS